MCGCAVDDESGREDQRAPGNGSQTKTPDPFVFPQAGKAPKVALTACMRKLLTMVNAMLKHRTPWREISAPTT
jgi:hypothetical protein